MNIKALQRFGCPVRKTGKVIYLSCFTKQNELTTITAFDLSGKKIETIYSEFAPAGELRLTWDLNDLNGNPVPVGIYIISINSGSFMKTEKVIVIR